MIVTTNITNGDRVLDELAATEPMKLPQVGQPRDYNPF